MAWQQISTIQPLISRETPDIHGLIAAAAADISAQLAKTVESVRAEIQQPKDGLPGKDGKDGVGLADAFIDKDHGLVLTFTDGTVKKMGVVVGRDGEKGEPGKDGRDGFSLDDFSMEYDGDRTVTFTLASGETRISKSFPLPMVLDRGVYAEGKQYAQGDGVTWGGSFWIAQKGTDGKPGLDPSWRLAVKKGSQGREGKPGATGPAGPPGPRGDKGDWR